MDPLSRLPVECLQLILTILNDSGNQFALASLLTMNKYIASVTLPILYCDPYSFSQSRVKPGQRNIERPAVGEMLTRLLLSRLENASFPKGLSLALMSGPVNPHFIAANASSLDYFAHIRHLNIKSYTSLNILRSWSARSVPRLQLEYIQSDEFNSLYRSTPFAPRFIAQFRTMDQALQHYYQVILHLEAVWCLAEPIFEQLRTFTIPYMFNIKQYHKVVNRFKSLEKIRFVMSEMFEDPFYSTILLQAKRAHNDEVIQDMIRFVQEHARLFVGQLKSVECLAGYMWEKLDQEYANHIRLEIYRLLPPLPMPICLDKYNWMQFCAHPQSTDLSHVQEFTYMGLPDGWENTICNDQSILQRCRALKRLYASTSCEVDFKWAVQEKNDMNRVGWIPMGNRTNDGHGALTSEMSTHGLVPLEHINLTLDFAPRADYFDDILFAFSDTLTELNINRHALPSLDRLQPVFLGRGRVNLLSLTSLFLDLVTNQLVLDSHFLLYCPNLKRLRLRDMTLEYSCQDIIPCLPAPLDKLDILNLSGWPALTFNPATLSSTAKLTSLNIQVRPFYPTSDIESPSFIPSVEELMQSYGRNNSLTVDSSNQAIDTVRPRWTWDWHLPLLYSLTVTSEFAYLFEFKMLIGCQALLDLTLDITSTMPGVHTRVICDTDLIVPTDINSSSKETITLLTSSKLATKHICLPSLTQLELNGEWVIDDASMPQFLVGMFPHVKTIRLNQWSIVTLESLLELLRAKPTKYDGSVDLQISDISLGNMMRLGIIRRQEENNMNTLPINISNIESNEYYSLLKALPE